MMWNVDQMSWFWPLCAVTGLILLSLGLVLFSSDVDQDARRRRHDKVLDVARERFARGEITAEEVDVLKRGLNL